jgi:hypothetical protein
MTLDALAGKLTSYYPEGRAQVRPGTLTPGQGESPSDVVESFVHQSMELQHIWASLPDSAWNVMVHEPEENPDLGSLSLMRLPLTRLTEVEVHGSDLALGLSEWSELFVELALPFRLEWLNVRRTNHREVDDQLWGSWLLAATDGPTYLITVTSEMVRSSLADPTDPALAVVEGSSRDILALLLGRPSSKPMRITGDRAFAISFNKAFPGP